MGIFTLNPLQDPRWSPFVAGHPQSSVFHTSQWLDALRRTYLYDPVVYTTTPPGRELTNGIAFCQVRSWASGDRLVSLPFSDHCQPLTSPGEFSELMDGLNPSREKLWKYIELRPLAPIPAVRADELTKSESFSLQTLDLRPPLDILFQHFHKSCVQRKIHRAERENLAYEEGRSETLVQKFYALLLQTRRRHGLPPQPLLWFRNVLACLGDRVLIRVASKDGQPVASIVTVQHKDVLVYKYGCSDSRFNNLGGNALLFWLAIQSAKKHGLAKFDLGRSASDNQGLVTFKENWGARSVPLDYYRLPARHSSHWNALWGARFARGIFSMMPDSLLSVTGRLLYRHIG